MSQNISAIASNYLSSQILSSKEKSASGTSFADQLELAKAATAAYSTDAGSSTMNSMGIDSSLFASMFANGDSGSMYNILSFILMFILMDQDNQSDSLPSAYVPDFSVSDYSIPAEENTTISNDTSDTAVAPGMSGAAINAGASAEQASGKDTGADAAADAQPVSGKNYDPIVSAALTRLGDPYSQAKAGRGDYTDCSYLSRWCYREAGIDLPRTAAAQAKWCVENGKTISKSELQPGDLIFFSLHENDRYMDITHVGIYAGNNMMVDASSAYGEVVYRQLFGGQVLYGRPR